MSLELDHSTDPIVSPAPGTWIVDPVHSDISFRVRHMGVGRVRGTFTLASADLTVGEDGATASGVRAVVDAASVVTGSEQRDQHIRSADFLDVENHPSIEFSSTQVRDVDGSFFAIDGDLTIHGVTRRVELAAECLGKVDDPSGGQRVGVQREHDHQPRRVRSRYSSRLRRRQRRRR